MKFIYAEESNKVIKFIDCEVNQFFVYCGDLYQKVSSTSANQLTFKGKPYANHCQFATYQVLDRLLPIVERIEF
jgi:hypothetical protein